MRFSVIIPAAGASTRYNAGDPEASGVLGEHRSKLDEELGGKALLQRTIELFNTRDDVFQIIVAGPHDDQAFDAFKAQHADRLALLGAIIVRGGRDHRWESVRAAIDAVDESCTHIAIHDAARPAATHALIDRVFAAAANYPAVIPGIPVSDTLKRVHPDTVENAGAVDQVAAILGDQSQPVLHSVEGGINRDRAMAIQTPQVFERGLLLRAYAQDELSSTDDAGLIERLGERVVIVAGEPTNIKLTHANELALLRAIMGVQAPSSRPIHKRF